MNASAIFEVPVTPTTHPLNLTIIPGLRQKMGNIKRVLGQSAEDLSPMLCSVPAKMLSSRPSTKCDAAIVHHRHSSKSA